VAGGRRRGRGGKRAGSLNRMHRSTDPIAAAVEEEKKKKGKEKKKKKK